ncbi:MAG: cytochrome c [Akkermansiaceae bacterium]
MSSNQSKQTPDLDEAINVTKTHGRVAREAAAATREKQLSADGHEPISLLVMVSCGIVLLIVGSVLGKASSWFEYDNFIRDGYVRSSAPGAGDTGPKAKAALAAFNAKGSKIYSSKCNGCHGADGKGDGANYPSLAGSDWVMGDTQQFAMIILNGLQGATSTGKVYGSGIMPAQGTGMNADDLAGVMTYVRNNFGNASGSVISKEMAQNAMDISASRDNPGSPITAEEIAAKHSQELPGGPLDPAVMVNPATLEPVE